MRRPMSLKYLGDSPVAVSEQGEALPQAQATAIMAGISHCLKVRLKKPARKSNLNYPQVISGLS